jgi:DNA-directed RNA polymerase specialized sigma24 family protein
MRRWGVTDRRGEFSDFYAAARDDCLQIVLVTVGDRQLAEDLVAEAFTRAWASWRAVRQHPAPRAWVVRTALNLSVSWWRRRRREVALGDSDPAAPGGDGCGGGGELLAAVRQLPVRQQQVIILRVFFGLDSQAAARALG